MAPLALEFASYLISTPLTLLVIGLVFTIMLTIAHHRLQVEVDPRVTAVREALPGANCGGCNYPGCDQFAEAVASEEAPPAACVVLGEEALQQIADIMGIEASAEAPKRAVIHCGAHCDERQGRTEYRGDSTCLGMNLVAGVQACTYGCLGLGDCADACPFDAIEIVDGLPIVDYVACTGCGNCVGACPRGIITLKSMIDDPLVVVACSSRDAAKATRASCKVGCIACGLCARARPETFAVKNDLCTIDYTPETYKQTGDQEAAIVKCPTVCLRLVGTKILDPHEQVEEREREKAAKAAAKAAAKTKKDAEAKADA